MLVRVGRRHIRFHSLSLYLSLKAWTCVFRRTCQMNLNCLLIELHRISIWKKWDLLNRFWQLVTEIPVSIESTKFELLLSWYRLNALICYFFCSCRTCRTLNFHEFQPTSADVPEWAYYLFCVVELRVNKTMQNLIKSQYLHVKGKILLFERGRATSELHIS